MPKAAENSALRVRTEPWRARVPARRRRGAESEGRPSVKFRHRCNKVPERSPAEKESSQSKKESPCRYGTLRTAMETSITTHRLDVRHACITGSIFQN